ncbi:hypothetical protein FHW64_006863 [Variovorax sp. Sphag1AA]|nr:hypothetical protein [Variovorax sp. Sphag1AA]
MAYEVHATRMSLPDGTAWSIAKMEMDLPANVINEMSKAHERRG